MVIATFWAILFICKTSTDSVPLSLDYLVSPKRQPFYKYITEKKLYITTMRANNSFLETKEHGITVFSRKQIFCRWVSGLLEFRSIDYQRILAIKFNQCHPLITLFWLKCPRAISVNELLFVRIHNLQCQIILVKVFLLKFKGHTIRQYRPKQIALKSTSGKVT